MKYLRAFAIRFKEPSSWAGLAAIISAIGLTIPAPISADVFYILAGVCGLLAFFIPEK